jgi:hypothetical protein
MRAKTIETLRCTADGVFIWPGAALVVRRGASFVRVSDQEICNGAAALHGASITDGPLIPALERAARFLERGQVEQAQATIAKLELPPLSPLGEELTRVAPNFFDHDKHLRWPRPLGLRHGLRRYGHCRRRHGKSHHILRLRLGEHGIHRR